MRCNRCGSDVPEFLFVMFEGKDHPIVIDRPMEFYRDDIIETDQIKIIAKVIVERKMCSDVFPNPTQAPENHETTDFDEPTDIPIKSLVIKEVLDKDGARTITHSSKEASLWDLLAMLEHTRIIIDEKIRMHMRGEHG